MAKKQVIPVSKEDVEVASQIDHRESKWPEWLRGLADWLGVKLSGENVKNVSIHDQSQAFNKTPLGSMSFASGATDIAIEFNGEAQLELAEAQSEIAKGKADAERERAKAEGEVLKIQARRRRPAAPPATPTYHPISTLHSLRPRPRLPSVEE